MEERILIRDQISHSPNKSSGHPIRGMSSVVATVSGYEGSERFKLIKLINETGASYVGALTKSTTHLVCFRLEGRKYDLAKEFGTNVVSHRWFEDCAIAGKRLPERRYFNQSGEQVGPLQSEVTIDRKKDNPLSRKKAKVLSYQSNTGNSSRARETDQRNLCPDSRFLNENSFPFSGTNDKISRKSKKSDLWNTWKQKFGSNSKQRSLERPLYDFDRVQHEEPSFYSSMVPGRQGDISSAINVDLEPTRKGRRLVKSNASRNISKSAILKFETNGICNQVRNISGETSHRSDDSSDENSLTVLDSDQECPSIEISNGPYSLNATSTSYRNETALPPQRTTLETGISNSENRNGELEDVRDDSNNITASNNSNNPVEDALSVENKTSKRSFSDYEDDMTRVKNNDNKFEEITCVICWTDFSSTRGVLPCGHRFCYSCIQQWADHMASLRKASTCPLCKANFFSITKVDEAASCDQKIYSQTIPHASSASDILVLPDWEIPSSRDQSSTTLFCTVCRSREPEDLLICCDRCRNRWIHSYCLDPPMEPWICMNCRDLRTLYLRYR